MWNDLTPFLPRSCGGSQRTHGVAVTGSGLVVVFRQGNPAIIVFSAQLKVEYAWGEWLGAHGLSLVETTSGTSIWLTDEASGRVAKMTLSGDVLMEIAPPPLDRRVDGKYSPTWVTENPNTGEFWLSDGYGSRLVHAHDPAGRHLYTLSGEEGAGRFEGPHGVGFSPAGELWITDRPRRRIVIYSARGRYLRHIDEVCHSPSMFGFRGFRVAVPELFGAVKILDLDLNVLDEIGINERVRPKAGWPDQIGWGWPVLPGYPDLNGTPEVRPGVFISPHCAALGLNDEVYVAEWMKGGRLTRASTTGRSDDPRTDNRATRGKPA